MGGSNSRVTHNFYALDATWQSAILLDSKLQGKNLALF